jgi:hypothetical protein
MTIIKILEANSLMRFFFIIKLNPMDKEEILCKNNLPKSRRLTFLNFNVK